MKNFIFISPNFPTNYWMFCRELKKNGLNVLGIGDQPYDELDYNVKENLNEYYKVSTLENYEEVYRAVAFLIFKYGRIDWLESNNEYWLERDARLRTEFHITSGFQESDIPRIKFKSKMKDYYKKAGIPTARFHMVDTEEKCLAFAKEVGYPVVAKVNVLISAVVDPTAASAWLPLNLPTTMTSTALNINCKMLDNINGSAKEINLSIMVPWHISISYLFCFMFSPLIHKFICFPQVRCE